MKCDQHSGQGFQNVLKLATDSGKVGGGDNQSSRYSVITRVDCYDQSSRQYIYNQVASGTPAVAGLF